MFNRPLDEITEEDLQALIDSKLDTQKIERKTVEYKKCLSPNEDKSGDTFDCSENMLNRTKDKIEFLADVSSFANTIGGYLFYGIREEAGLPVELVGLKIDVDKQKQQMQNQLRDNIEPRLHNADVDIHPVPLTSKPGYSVIVLHIRQSWRMPHRVNREGHAHFYVRDSAGKHPLDIAEVRAAFELSGSMAAHIHNFRTERLSRIIACEELPAILDENAPKIVLHMIPWNAFNSGVSLDISALDDPYKANMMGIISARPQPSAAPRFNLDGIVRFAQEKTAYTQVFNRGIIEAVDIAILKAYNDKKHVPGNIIELALLQAVKRYVGLQQFLNVEPPVVIMVSFLGVRGYRIIDDPYKYMPEDFDAIDRRNLVIPESIMDTFERGDDQIAKTMKPIFDTMWNAANYSSSPFYDTKTGKYKNPF